VSSSSISSVGYDAGRETLEVEFHSGRVYQYYGVPSAVHQKLVRADSIGGYFNSRIRPNYPYAERAAALTQATGSSSRRSAAGASRSTPASR
jgi:hypothetical protein